MFWRPSTRSGRSAKVHPAVAVLGLLLLISFSNECFAKVPALPAGFVQGVVLNEGALVYSQPDFDATIIGRMKQGTRLPISEKVFGAFHEIIIGGQRRGFITDIDARPLEQVKRAQALLEKQEGESKSPAEKARDLESRLDKALLSQRTVQGLEVAMIRFREKTMGLRPTDHKAFFGFSASGPQVLISGLQTDLNVLFSPGAPRYYEEATGQPSDGFIFLSSFLLQATTDHSPLMQTYFGFGPMHRYSRYGVTVVNAGTGDKRAYSLEDMALGVQFQWGFARRITRDLRIKAEINYHWEKLQYWGLALSFQWPVGDRESGGQASKTP